MYGYIYETTNLINGKKYIGKHVSTKFDECYKGSGSILKKAFKKYGFENFECKILEECVSDEDLNNKEIYYINLFKADKDLNYYNLSSGGEYSIKGLFNMYNPKLDKVIVSNIDNIDFYKSKGFELGMRPHSKESNKKLSETRKNLVAMTDGLKTVWVKKELVEDYKFKGFVKGLHKPSRPNQKQENRKWINKDGKSIMVKSEDLDKYIEDGYSLGRVKFSHFNRVAPAWNKGIPASEEAKEKNRQSHLKINRK